MRERIENSGAAGGRGWPFARVACAVVAVALAGRAAAVPPSVEGAALARGAPAATPCAAAGRAYATTTTAR